MTTVNIVVRPDRVIVVADSAGLDLASGRFARHVQKIAPLPHLNAVIAARGTYDLAEVIFIFAARMASTYDDLKACIAPKMRGEFQNMRANADKIIAQQRIAQGDPNLPATIRLDADIFVAGWSEGLGRPDAYLVATHDQHAEIEPWTVVDLPRGILTPPISEAWNTAVANHPEPMGLMPTALGLQRKALDASRPGGYAMAATVSRRSITTRIIGQWPDRLGEPLDPEAPFEEWPVAAHVG